MNCGFCGSQMLHERRDGSELDRCEGCGAWFFDRGEFAAILGDDRAERSVALALRGPEALERPCGRCAGELRQVRVADGAGHPSDAGVAVCLGCHGLLVSQPAIELARDAGIRGIHHTPHAEPGAAKRRVLHELLDVVLEFFMPH